MKQQQLGNGPFKRIHMSNFFKETRRHLHYSEAFKHIQHIIHGSNESCSIPNVSFSKCYIGNGFPWPRHCFSRPKHFYNNSKVIPTIII